MAHPGKMLPAIARRAIETYTAPGDLVLDPMCGIGTTLVEAMHLGRHAVGVESEPRWAELANANIANAMTVGTTATGHVITGDARELARLVAADVHGRVALVLTSPPYGDSVHGHVRTNPTQGVAKLNTKYSDDPTNLACTTVQALLEATRRILASCVQLVRPGGVVAITARPWRRDGELVDLPGALVLAGEQAGLVPFERNIALLAGLRRGTLVPRASFFQLDNVRKARSRGVPQHVIAHEDLLVFRNEWKAVNSGRAIGPEREPRGPRGE